MEVILSKNAGFCYGVKRAVDMAVSVQEKYNKKIYTLGPLIHNNDVVSYLKTLNIFPIEIEDIENLEEDDIVIIRSHGIPLEIFNKLKEKGVITIDATCTYVSNIQQKVKKYFDSGYSILIVGDKNHPEVIGINGWCDNSAIITNDSDELKHLPRKICVVSQTTEKQSRWENVLEKVVKFSKEIVAFNTICSATGVRQKAAYDLSEHVDCMIVVGGKNSSNTTKLYEICAKNCNNTIHIENSNEIPLELLNNKNIKKIGITAGASTPDWVINETINKLSNR